MPAGSRRRRTPERSSATRRCTSGYGSSSRPPAGRRRPRAPHEDVPVHAHAGPRLRRRPRARCAGRRRRARARATGSSSPPCSAGSSSSSRSTARRRSDAELGAFRIDRPDPARARSGDELAGLRRTLRAVPCTAPGAVPPYGHSAGRTSSGGPAVRERTGRLEEASMRSPLRARRFGRSRQPA